MHFKTKRRVEFAETDLANVMHFANYLRWMEEAEHEMFRSVGMSVIMPRAEGVLSWPRVIASCEYFGPLRFEDEVEIGITITDLGSKSITYEALFSCKGQRMARGRVKAVSCMMSEGKFSSVSIPTDVRAKLETLRTRGAGAAGELKA